MSTTSATSWSVVTPRRGKATRAVCNQQVGLRNACDLARRFRAAGIEVVLADLVTSATAALYRRHLQDVQIMRLRLPLDEAHRRAQLRPIHLTDYEFDNLYRFDAASTFPVDHVIDVTDLDSDGQTEAVRRLWLGA